MSVDLPEPDTPVIQVIKPNGIFKSTFFKLLPVAPNSSSHLSLVAWRSLGISILRTPDKNWPVTESLLAKISSRVP